MFPIISQADYGRLGDSDCSPILRAGEEELDGDDCLGEVPETSWAVPQIPSPPTASGLHWPKDYQNLPDCAVYVPDVCSSPLQHFNQSQSPNLKRWKQQVWRFLPLPQLQRLSPNWISIGSRWCLLFSLAVSHFIKLRVWVTELKLLLAFK